MLSSEPRHFVRFDREALSAYRRAQSSASNAERSVADVYSRIASRLGQIESILRQGKHHMAVPLIEQVWLTIFYITSVLDSSQRSDIIARIKALNLFVMKGLARARRSGLAKDIEELDGVAAQLGEIFLALDSAKGSSHIEKYGASSPEPFAPTVLGNPPPHPGRAHRAAAQGPGLL